MKLVLEHEIEYMKLRGGAKLCGKETAENHTIDIGYVNDEKDVPAALAMSLPKNRIRPVQSEFLIKPHVINEIQDRDETFYILGWNSKV